MSKFIKLGTTIINSAYVRKIVIEENKCHIHMTPKSLGGFFFVGSGVIDADDQCITIDKNKDPHVYLKITDWIKNV